ncbi:MAG TPA: dTMP kinase [Candidatus Baltobacteraceae bacterium]|jgi:dTMP kinase|nr:dTMP kinase [Candidatus Baltobacteraceae bacterium]
MNDVSTLPKPRFIVIEGGDGSGKTSIREFLFAAFTRLGRMPLSITGSSWMDLRSTEMITKARYLKIPYSHDEIRDAYVQDRVMLCDTLIRPALAERDVICDRYVYSDLVYNDIDYDIGKRAMARAYRDASLIEPSLIVHLDVSPEIAVARLRARGKPMNPWETLEKQMAIRQGFKEVLSAAELGWSCPVYNIDSTLAPDEVIARVSVALDLGDLLRNHESGSAPPTP